MSASARLSVRLQDIAQSLAEVLDELISFTGDPKLDRHDDLVDILSYSVDQRSMLVTTSGSGPTAVPAPKPGAQLQQRIQPTFKPGGVRRPPCTHPFQPLGFRLY